MLTTSEYAQIRDCLDPTREVVSDEKARAFHLFTSRYDLLVGQPIGLAPLTEDSPAVDAIGERGEQRAA